jgi:Ran GTPase-activating protein (RanGAP) involved in mRNA processing and transport
LIDSLKNKPIEELILSHNAFGPDGIKSFQEFLEICPTLKILDVTNCGVGPKGCEMLAESLLKNKECRLTEFYASRDRLEDSISYLGKVFI